MAKFLWVFFPPMVVAGNGWLQVTRGQWLKFCCFLLIYLFIYLRLQVAIVFVESRWLNFCCFFRWWGLPVASGGCGF